MLPQQLTLCLLPRTMCYNCNCSTPHYACNTTGTKHPPWQGEATGRAFCPSCDLSQRPKPFPPHTSSAQSVYFLCRLQLSTDRARPGCASSPSSRCWCSQALVKLVKSPKYWLKEMPLQQAVTRIREKGSRRWRRERGESGCREARVSWTAGWTESTTLLLMQG